MGVRRWGSAKNIMIPWELRDKGREQRLGQRKNQKAGKDIKPSATSKGAMNF
jgi:hypothetical protein